MSCFFLKGVSSPVRIDAAADLPETVKQGRVAAPPSRTTSKANDIFFTSVDSRQSLLLHSQAPTPNVPSSTHERSALSLCADGA